MRALASITFILLLLGKLFYGLVIQVNFYMNRAEIIRLECENKDRPALNCNGQCYLAKQLKRTDQELSDKKEENRRALNTIKSLESSAFISSGSMVCPTQITTIEVTHSPFDHYREFHSSDHSHNVFHPPVSLT